MNLIDGFGFTKTGGSKKGGGKGGTQKGAKKGGGPQYSVNVAFALCQGPISYTGAPHAISGSNRIWSNGGVEPASAIPLNYYTGADGQAPDPIFASASGHTPALGYSGTAYVTGTPLHLGSSPVLPNIQGEITGFGAGTAGPDLLGDARPDWIVVDMLTNSRYGAGFPVANLDCGGAWDGGGSVTDWGVYCQASTIGMSYLMDRQQPVARWLEEIVDTTSSAIFWSGTKLKIVPYAGAAVSGNGTSWSPTLVSQYALTDRDFIDFGGGSDPVLLGRQDLAQIANWINVEFQNSDTDYNTETTQVFDQAAIDSYGLVIEPNFMAGGCSKIVSATAAGQIRLDRGHGVRNQYKFKLGWQYALLEPMDIVTISDAAAGLTNLAVRIIQIDEDENGEMSITAEEIDTTAVITPLREAPATTPLYDVNVDPGDATPPIIFEPPPALTGGAREVWIISSGGEDFGGCHVWVSTDDTTYAMVGTIYAGARQGVLTADLPSGSDPDVTNTLSISLSQSRGQLLSGTTAAADQYETLCYADGELLSYETATLTAAYQYDLTYLRRGAYGTPIGAHLSGSKFARLNPHDGTIFRFQFPANFSGQTLYVKLAAFNIFFGQTQDLAGLTAYSYVLSGLGGVVSSAVPIQYLGIPQNGNPIVRHTFGSTVIFPAGLVGSVCTASAAATALTTFNIGKNGSLVGTMSFAASSTSATFAMASAETFVAGDVLTITPTSTDATLENLSGYLAGSS
ncbi:MAG: phage tail protein [Alphaproteobacteria bacterium]